MNDLRITNYELRSDDVGDTMRGDTSLWLGRRFRDSLFVIRHSWL
jgi:hypothetical protein